MRGWRLVVLLFSVGALSCGDDGLVTPAPTGDGSAVPDGGAVADAPIGSPDGAAPADVPVGPPDDTTAPADIPPSMDVPIDDGGAPPVEDVIAPVDTSPTADADAVPPPENACCETSEAPGCNDPGIMECVCAEVPVCCQVGWSAKCIEAASVLCHAGCGGGGGGGSVVCGDGACDATEACDSCPADCGFCPGSGDCCEPHDSQGCDSLATTTCVCEMDPYCCQAAWDEQCVGEAGSGCGAGCVTGPTCGDGDCEAGEGCEDCPSDCGVCAPGDCCVPRSEPGCESPSIEACVCEADPFCCATAWDSLCVGGAKTPCGADCQTAPADCGDGLCDGSEGCELCPADCGACGTGDCCVASKSPGCGDAGVQACVCGKDDFCCTNEWDDLCAAAAEGCGAICGGTGPCECEWAEVGCGAKSAVLELVPLDVWAQVIPGAKVDVKTAAGQPIASEGGATWHIPLCGKASVSVTMSAADHDPLAGTLSYDGKGAAGGVAWKPLPGGAKVAWSLTTDVRTVGGAPVRHYTLYSGLAHRWYAPSGRPARRGTRITLLRDGEEAWATVNAELSLAKTRINASSWWWTSEVEIVRDPAVHVWLSKQDRWKNTIMGTLEGLWGVDRRVMVNQFYSQDGMLSSMTVDDELIAKAKAAADDFEFMGAANDVHGAFVVKPKPVDFAARLAAADGAMVVPGAATVASAPYPAFSGPIAVDTTELPAGLGWLDLPIASWHQKFMTIDDDIAFIGGMNFKTTDWDTHDHKVFEELRSAFDASSDERIAVQNKESEPDFGPRKDYMVRLEGPAAADAEDVFHARWVAQLAADVQYADQSTSFVPFGPSAPLPDGQQVQVVSTMPAPFSENAILEALLRAIPQANDYIFIEDQYFRAPILIEKVIERMQEKKNLVLIVVTNPMDEWKDPGCWQTYLVNEELASKFPGRYRTYETRSFDWVDTDCTFCWDEVEAHFVPHDLHSKLVIIDDKWIEVGSCNSNNRGLLYEGELAVVTYDPDVVSKARDAVFANLVGPDYAPGTAPSSFITVFDSHAAKNQTVWDEWDDEGMDLDLDGAPLPNKYKPSGFLYPLSFGAPDDCFIEGVGPDVM